MSETGNLFALIPRPRDSTTASADTRTARPSPPSADLPVHHPALLLGHLLEGFLERLGIELDAYGLTGLHYTRVQAALTDFFRLEDASNLVTELRVVKSRAELACSRKAGELADAALVEANRLAVPGAWGGDILAAMQGAVF